MKSENSKKFFLERESVFGETENEREKTAGAAAETVMQLQLIL